MAVIPFSSKDADPTGPGPLWHPVLRAGTGHDLRQAPGFSGLPGWRTGAAELLRHAFGVFEKFSQRRPRNSVDIGADVMFWR